LLNYNPADPEVPNDVRIYRYIEAISRELQNGEIKRPGYMLLDSDGRAWRLFDCSPDWPDGVSGEPGPAGTHMALAHRFLQHYLVAEAQHRPHLDLSIEAVLSETCIDPLVAMVPPEDIIG
jgi:hypothetical protein